MKVFTLTCLWHGVEGKIVKAESGEAALEAFAKEHGYRLWGEYHYPAESADFVDSWGAYFQGQTWSNGDFNIESVSVYEAEISDVAAPC